MNVRSTYRFAPWLLCGVVLLAGMWGCGPTSPTIPDGDDGGDTPQAPDSAITITSPSAADTLTLGQIVTIRWRVDAQLAGQQVRVFADLDTAVGSGNEFVITTLTVTPEGSVQFDTSALAIGESYYFGVSLLAADGTVINSSYATGQISIQVPTLRFTNPSQRVTVSAGTPVQLAWQVTSVPSDATVRVFRDLDGRPGTGDEVNVDTVPLTAGTSTTMETLGLPQGSNYWIGATLRYRGETIVTTYAPGTVRIAAFTLTVLSPSKDMQISLGQTVNMSWVLNNLLPGATIRLFYDQDGVLGSGDEQIFAEGLDPTSASYGYATHDLALALTYRFGAQLVINDVVQATAYAPGAVTVSDYVLTVTGPELPMTLGLGEPVPVTWEVIAPPAASSVRVFFDRDRVQQSGDEVIAVEGLAAGSGSASAGTSGLQPELDYNVGVELMLNGQAIASQYAPGTVRIPRPTLQLTTPSQDFNSVKGGTFVLEWTTTDLWTGSTFEVYFENNGVRIPAAEAGDPAIDPAAGTATVSTANLNFGVTYNIQADLVLQEGTPVTAQAPGRVTILTPVLTVNEPVDDTSVAKGSPLTVTWDAGAAANVPVDSTATIFFEDNVSGDTFDGVAGVPFANGQANVSIPAELTVGNVYKVGVQMVLKDGTVYASQYAQGLVTVDQYELDVTSPTTNQALEDGDALDILWTVPFAPEGSVINIFLDDDDDPTNGRIDVSLGRDPTTQQATLTIDVNGLQLQQDTLYRLGLELELNSEVLAIAYADTIQGVKIDVVIVSLAKFEILKPGFDFRARTNPDRLPVDIEWQFLEPANVKGTEKIELFYDDDMDYTNGVVETISTGLAVEQGGTLVTTTRADILSLPPGSKLYVGGRLLDQYDNQLGDVSYAPGVVTIPSDYQGIYELIDIGRAISGDDDRQIIDGVTFLSTAENEQAGYAVVGLGQQNGDAVDDFAILARYGRPLDQGADRGLVYVVYGKNGERFTPDTSGQGVRLSKIGNGVDGNVILGPLDTLKVGIDSMTALAAQEDVKKWLFLGSSRGAGINMTFYNMGQDYQPVMPDEGDPLPYPVDIYSVIDVYGGEYEVQVPLSLPPSYGGASLNFWSPMVSDFFTHSYEAMTPEYFWMEEKINAEGVLQSRAPKNQAGVSPLWSWRIRGEMVEPQYNSGAYLLFGVAPWDLLQYNESIAPPDNLPAYDSSEGSSTFFYPNNLSPLQIAPIDPDTLGNDPLVPSWPADPDTPIWSSYDEDAGTGMNLFPQYDESPGVAYIIGSQSLGQIDTLVGTVGVREDTAWIHGTVPDEFNGQVRDIDDGTGNMISPGFQAFEWIDDINGNTTRELLMSLPGLDTPVITELPDDPGNIGIVTRTASGTVLIKYDFNVQGFSETSGGSSPSVSNPISQNIQILRDTSTLGLAVVGMADDEIGSATGLGDFNDDGTSDMAVGAPGSQLGGTEAGAVYIVYMSRLTSGGYLENTIDLQTIVDGSPDPNQVTAVSGLCLTGLPGDQIGNRVSRAGDFDGDGQEDVMFLTNPTASASRGTQLYVVLTGDELLPYYETKFNHPLKGQESILNVGNDIPGISFADNDGDGHDNLEGASVHPAGDINQDGLDDILLVCPNLKVDDKVRGGVYLIYGKQWIDPDANGVKGIDYDDDGNTDTRIDLGRIGLSKTENGIPGAVFRGKSVAESVTTGSAGGDLDNDGTPDFLIGAPKADRTETDTGEAYLLYGRKASLWLDVVRPDSDQQWIVGNNYSIRWSLTLPAGLTGSFNVYMDQDDIIGNGNAVNGTEVEVFDVNDAGPYDQTTVKLSVDTDNPSLKLDKEYYVRVYFTASTGEELVVYAESAPGVKAKVTLVEP